MDALEIPWSSFDFTNKDFEAWECQHVNTFNQTNFCESIMSRDQVIWFSSHTQLIEQKWSQLRSRHHRWDSVDSDPKSSLDPWKVATDLLLLLITGSFDSTHLANLQSFSSSSIKKAFDRFRSGVGTWTIGSALRHLTAGGCLLRLFNIIWAWLSIITMALEISALSFLAFPQASATDQQNKYPVVVLFSNRSMK